MKERGYAAVLTLVYLLLFIAGAIGWVRNIITIAHSGLDQISGMLILRIVGIFVAPLGAVLGYF
jgi:hypothetical protein